MSDIAVLGSVSRTELALADLNISDGVNYELTDDGFTPGAKTFRKMTTTSPYVEGRFLQQRVADVSIATIKLRCRGTDEAVLMGNVDALVTAFSQMAFLVTIQIGTQVWGYSCETADSITFGDSGTLGKFEWMVFRQVVTIVVPHRPTDAFSTVGRF